MSSLLATQPRPITYPDSDGEPMSDNTVQFDAIMTIEANLEILFRDDPQVFVAGDLLWYPVEGNNKLRAAPSVLVAFGVPKGDRGSYRQWEENDIPPQVVFEVLSFSNLAGEMTRRFAFYEEHGVQEYYIFDPEDGRWDGWLRLDGRLRPIDSMIGWVSPRLKIRFEQHPNGDLLLFHPDGERFLSSLEMDSVKREALEATQLERLAREQAQRRADQAQQQAAQAQQQAAQAQQQAAQAQQRADRLSEQLRAAGIEPSEA